MQIIVDDWPQQQQVNKDPDLQPANCCVGQEQQHFSRGALLRAWKTFVALYNTPESWGRPDDTVCGRTPGDRLG